MANKINIFGDIRVCSKCGDPAVIVEKGKDFCAECYSLTVWQMPLSKVGEDLDKREGIKLRVVKS